MKQNKLFKIRFIICIITVVVITISIFAYGLARRDIQRQSRLRVMKEISGIKANLKIAIHSTFWLINGMTAYVAMNPDITEQEFNVFALNLYIQSPYIRHLALAPNNVIRYVYPLEGNEQVVGLNLAEYPEQKEAVFEMMRTGKTVIAGPVELVQGGKAFINRTPIFITENDGSKVYWGMISTAIYIDDILKASGIVDKYPNLIFAIRGKDGKGADGDVFFGDARIFMEDPILLNITLPIGSWQLAVVPKAGWNEKRPWRQLAFLILVNLIIVSLMLYISYQIKQNQQYQTKLKEGEEKFRLLAENSADVIWTSDLEGNFIYVSPSITRLTGYIPREALQHTYKDVLTPKSYALVEEKLKKATQRFNKWDSIVLELEYRKKDGQTVWTEVKVSQLISEHKIYGLIGITRDISKQKKLKEELKQLATTDSLTLLNNRRSFEQLFKREVEKSIEDGNPLSVLMIDVDSFKSFNDNYGHKVGDVILAKISEICKLYFRHNDILARYGGEEFLVVLPSMFLDDAVRVAEGLRQRIEKSEFVIEEQWLKVTVSIGVTHWNQDDKDIYDTVHRADKALYLAKNSGRNKVMMIRCQDMS